MIRLVFPLLLLAGCVAPEPEPVARRRPPPVAETAPRPDLEPAPLANRGLKAPDAVPVFQVDGLSNKPKKKLPPI